MTIERISQSLRFDLGDRFFILYGPGVNDAFISPDYRECKVEEALWLTLQAQKFRRIIFFSAQRGLYFLDDVSRKYAHNNPIGKTSTSAPHELSGGPLGDLNIAHRDPASEHDTTSRTSPSMGETHILRLLNSYMQDTGGPKTALVIIQAENTLGTFEQQRSLAGWLGEWARLPRSNPHVCILLAASDLEEMLREPLQRPWSELPELTAQLKWRSGQNSNCNVARIGPPTETEITRLLEYTRLKDGVQVNWLGRHKRERWMAAEGLWARQWLANLTAARRADLETARQKGWFLATNPDPRSAWERLEAMTGLESVKAKIREMKDFLQVELERQTDQFQASQPNLPSLHLVFLGNPGTGKTTVARLVGEMYRDIGLLRRGHTISPKISELVSNHVGESAIWTNAIIDKALDGVLFIDEAYQLAEKERGAFGQEVIDTLLIRMENDRARLVVIVAGYTQKMQEFLQSNPGLLRRFPPNNRIEFPDYHPDELELILKSLLAENRLACSSEMRLSLREVITGLYAARDEKFGNAGEMRNLAEAIHTARNSRVARDHLDKNEPIRVDDLPQEYRGYLAPPVPELPELMAELDSLVGLEIVKDMIRKLVARVRLDERRRQQGLTVKRQPLHLVFTGNPGTGKTTVARLLGRIFKAVGLLRKGHIIEVDRAELVSDHVGGTALKTNDKIKRALDGVLFIDEAYSLAEGMGTGIDYGKESINTLVKGMEDHKDRLVVIAAGYPDDMQKFVQSNPGLKDRFTTYIPFPDFIVPELVEILNRKITSEGYILPESVSGHVSRCLTDYQRLNHSLPNARKINSLFTEMSNNLAERLDSPEARALDGSDLSTFTIEDLPGWLANPPGEVTSVTTRQTRAYVLRLPPAPLSVQSLQTAQQAVGYVSIQMKDGSQASGTGFCITPQGEFLTAYHVVEIAQAVLVRLEGFPGRDIPASLVGWDAAADLALLKLPQGREYPWLALAGAGQPAVSGAKSHLRMDQ